MQSESFNPTGFSQEIFKSRYAAPGEESWGELCQRVSNYVMQGDAPEHAEYVYYLMDQGKFFPAGRTLHGAGREGWKGNLLNCFIFSVEDNVESIGDLHRDMYITATHGGGTGYNASKIRPKGSDIGSHKCAAPGVVSLALSIDGMLAQVRAGGARRAAILGALSINHPDTLEWIRVKQQLGVLENHNISLYVNDDFINAVKNDKPWVFHFNGTPWKTFEVAHNEDERFLLNALDEGHALEILDNFYRKDTADTFRIVKELNISAKWLWRKLCQSNLRCAEPALLNESAIQRNYAVGHVEPFAGNNPCQPAWATVLTPKGISTIGNIEVGDEIWTGTQWANVKRKVYTGVKDVNAYRTTAGTFYGTENHRVFQKGVRLEAKDAESIDMATGPYQKAFLRCKQDVIDGLTLGDGMFHKATNSAMLDIGRNDQDYFNTFVGDYVKHSSGTTHYVKTTLTQEELPRTHERCVPDRFKFADSVTVRSFLRGLYSANGSVISGANRITLKASSFQMIEDVQQMLSSLGIRSYYTTNKPSRVAFPNGEYDMKQSYDLNITSDRNKFMEGIGFIQEYKQNKYHRLESNARKTTYEVISVEHVSTEPVWDIEVDAEEHSYWTGGLLVSNCTEAVTGHHGNCTLGSINLDAYVDEYGFDWDALGKDIPLMIRFLDNVLSKTVYPLNTQRNAAMLTRRVGLGVMGYAHALIALGLRYGSPEALEFTEKLSTHIRDCAFQASINLAREKGPCHAAPGEFHSIQGTEHTNKYLSCEYQKRLPKHIQAGIRQFGIRNAVLLSIAPTGTIGTLAGVSTGIEPIFAPAFERRWRNGDYWMTEVILDPKFREAVESGGDASVCVGAYDITPREHLATVVAWQKNVDQSISKTTNCPSSQDAAEFSDTLLEYIDEMKGVSTYMDGSRGDSPLKTLPIEKAIELASSTSTSEHYVQDCATGSCDIPLPARS